MPRTNRSAEKRSELLPEIARAFAELGYRRTTTAVLARRCRVRENILYRLWPDKRAMFTACIDYMYDVSRFIWGEQLRTAPAGRSAAERLLRYEAGHIGELGLYRIVFAGLSEADDPEIRRHLRAMFRRFHRFVADQVRHHRGAGRGGGPPGPEIAAWAILGLGTLAYVGRELELLPPAGRARLLREAGALLLEGRRT